MNGFTLEPQFFVTTKKIGRDNLKGIFQKVTRDSDNSTYYFLLALVGYDFTGSYLVRTKALNSNMRNIPWLNKHIVRDMRLGDEGTFLLGSSLNSNVEKPELESITSDEKDELMRPKSPRAPKVSKRSKPSVMASASVPIPTAVPAPVATSTFALVSNLQTQPATTLSTLFTTPSWEADQAEDFNSEIDSSSMGSIRKRARITSSSSFGSSSIEPVAKEARTASLSSTASSSNESVDQNQPPVPVFGSASSAFHSVRPKKSISDAGARTLFGISISQNKKSAEEAAEQFRIGQG